jgi:tetratricopeptide (TPR) repeat protein
MVARRLDALPVAVRRLAETVAVAGRPLPVQVLAEASELTTGVAEAFARLDGQGLARLDFRNEREVAEPFHDRIREAVVGQMSPSVLRERHDRLATLLGLTSGVDLEALAIHLLGAGKSLEAVGVAERAAAEAASKFAFDQSARLLRMALEATPESGEDALRLRVALARTLVQAGRVSAAADEFGRAAQRATGMDRVELERAAAEQLLMSGRVDDGHLALRRVLDTMGVSVPRSALGAVLLLVVYQLRLRLAGVRVRERGASEVTREDRVRIDTLRSVSSGLAAVDVVLGACVQAKHLLTAMEHGDRTQVLQGLCARIIQLAILGRPESKREKAMMRTVGDLAQKIGPDVEPYLTQTSGLALYMRGHYREALEKLDLVSRAAPGGWGTANARLFALFCCFFVGKHREVARRGPRLLREVEERGDLYTAVSLRATIMVDIAIADDDPQQARDHVKDAMSRWTQNGFHAQHWYAMWSGALIELYRGNAATALATLERDAPKLRRSFLLRAQMVRGLTAYLRGCCVVASIDEQPSLRAERVAEARRIARQLGRETAAWAPTLATAIRAAAEIASGDRGAAVNALRDALAHAQAAHLGPQAWAAQYRLGMALGGEEGRTHIALAEGAMREEGVRSPERTAYLLLPGRWPTV